MNPSAQAQSSTSGKDGGRGQGEDCFAGFLAWDSMLDGSPNVRRVTESISGLNFSRKTKIVGRDGGAATGFGPSLFFALIVLSP